MVPESAERIRPGAVFLLAVLVALPFLPPLFTGFFGDDFRQLSGAYRILEDPGARIPAVLLPPSGGKGPEFLRPLYHLSFLPEMWLFGRQPVAFHAGNLLLHVFVSLSAAAAARRFFGGWIAPAAAALLTAWHPLAVEPAGWISARATLLATALGNTALLFAFQAGRRPRVAAFGAFVWLLALCAKESAVGYGPVLFALSLSSGIPGARRRSHFRAVLTFAAVLLLYLGWRVFLFEGIGMRIYPDRPAFDPLSPGLWAEWVRGAVLVPAPFRRDAYPALAVAFGFPPAVLLLLASRRKAFLRGAGFVGL